MKTLLEHIACTINSGNRKAEARANGISASHGGRSTRGETLTEVLVATAIGGLALLMLAVAISASTNMAVKSRANMGEYYAANNVIVEESSAQSTPGELTLKGGSTNTPVPLVDDASIPITYYASEKYPDIVLYASQGEVHHDGNG